MNVAVAVIAAVVIVVIPAAIVGYMFLWAAVKDGEYDDATQKRLRIRRRTRLGPD